ncbi:hypothetical protein Aasi_1071 [Candidatus Amoebophilus asiaticus 5a2]|uniref:Uncharacterized protein n=1 Tax=Amoebophilus asiaticus (strain 5a2) TaxID=452471 RepID=B3ET64_AMOA5|nr:ankyrin repeat domain-containing protein [Candidatus Amoebophilus asiaticus]ACE06416.1 hypothetical protein Aasi_1071 [Candidatus Amoebophilus asiaticus 5a2]
MITKVGLTLFRPFLYTLYRVSYILTIILFLKSCNHFATPSNLIITTKSNNAIQTTENLVLIEQQEAENTIISGYTITLYQTGQTLQAIVKKYLFGDLYGAYDLPAYIGADMNLLHLTTLNKQRQKELVHIYVNEEECPSYVYIGALDLFEVNITVDDQQDSAVLHWAAASGDVEMVKVLLTEGFNVYANDSHGNSSLHFAAINNHPETIHLLLQSGINVNVKNKDGNTALHGAAVYGYIEVIQALLAQGADVNSKNKDGNSVLHLAAAYGQTEVLKILLDAGADIHARNQENNSALHLAAYKCQDKATRILIARGATIDSKNKLSLTPIEVAVKYNNSTNIGELGDC